MKDRAKRIKNADLITATGGANDKYKFDEDFD
jgi:hypothetical protein